MRATPQPTQMNERYETPIVMLDSTKEGFFCIVRTFGIEPFGDFEPFGDV